MFDFVLEAEVSFVFECVWIKHYVTRFPWGQEAFEKAKSEDKPIFLSGKILG